ncbi:MAG: hypothetical protein J0G28_03960 [Afipia sp.]|nr:hypothetical protein [Afipia sp.]OJW64057.1 MAG: hypothetical protein BGO65_04630 [Afipia sp. 64-13]
MARVLMAAALLGSPLAGCSLPIGDLPVVGLPENTPARPETPAAYLPVHDIPAPRDTVILTPDEQVRIEKELAAARERQTHGQAPGAASTQNSHEGR